MMGTLTDALTNSDAAKDVLDLFIKLAKRDPKFFRRQLRDVVYSMLEIAEDEKLEMKTRHLAVEFVLTLVEARKKAPGMMKKIPLFTHTCFAVLLSLLLDIKDEPNWQSAEEDLYEAAVTDNLKFGRRCLDRFSNALGGKTIAYVAMEQLGDYLVAPEWEKRHAALDAFFQIAKGCSKACAASAVQSFCQSDKPETVLPYLDKILNKLLVLIQNANQMVLIEAITALTCIVMLSKEHFQKHYDSIVPYLKTILVNANDNCNHIILRCALDCITAIWLTADRDKFRDDLKQVLEVITLLKGSQVKQLDTIVYILQACFKLCVIMEKDFLPYMSIVMPPLVECAQLEPDKTASSYERDETIHKVKVGDAIICVKEGDLLRAKSTACALLGGFALALEEDFYPWISQAASILVPLLKFNFHSKVREHACAEMYHLLDCAKLAMEKGAVQGGIPWYFKQLCGDIIMALGDALYLERNTKVCAHLLKQLNKCLKICGPFLDEYQIGCIIDEIKHIIKESSRRKGELAERAKSEDFDAEDAELMRGEIEQETKVFGNVGDILSTLIKTFKAGFLPFLDKLSLYLIPVTGEDTTAEERKTCILIFDHIVEHCGEPAIKYYKTYLPFLLDSSDDENPDVRQVALYGLGLCAEYGGYFFKPFAGEALSKINAVITHNNALEPENVTAHDNAVSSLGKICQFHRDSIHSAQIISAWLNCLPIKKDLVEAKVVHEKLCSMVERSDIELFGPRYEHLPKILSIFAEVLCAGKDLATEETINRIKNLSRNLKKTLPPAIWASAWSFLLPQQAMELEAGANLVLKRRVYLYLAICASVWSLVLLSRLLNSIQASGPCSSVPSLLYSDCRFLYDTVQMVKQILNL